MKITDLNKKMYSIHNICFDCVIEMEAKIKLEGKWEEYERGMVKSNARASLQDFERALEAWHLDKDTFVSENGDIENWGGGDKTKMYEEIRAKLQEIKSSDIY